MERKTRIGILNSGFGTIVEVIINACKSGGINGEVVFIGTDRPKIISIDIAKKNNIPWFTSDYKLLGSHTGESELNRQVGKFEFDLLVLACFRRILSSRFVDQYSPDSNNPRIVNIHPSLLPAFTGLDACGQAYRYGCKVGGCTVHFVDHGLDTGPIITQEAYLIDDNDSIEDIRKKGFIMQCNLLLKSLKYFAEGRIKIDQKNLDRRVVRIIKKGEKQ